MTIFYSPSTNLTYDGDAGQYPEDGIEISEELNTALIDGVNTGAYQIVFNEESGLPELASYTPPVVVPSFVTRRQGMQQLFLDGDLGLVQPIIDSMSDPEKTMTQLAFDNAQTFERSDPYFDALADALGKTEEEKDAFFIAAKAL